MGRKIIVTSGKGGVGKTTIVAGLGRALAKLNASVCVVDGDIGLNNLDLILGVENKVVYDLCDCMQGKCRIKQAIIKDEKLDNLYTLPAGKNMPLTVVFTFDSIINKLATIFDYVIVDSPAGKDEGFMRAAKSCDEAIIVVTPHISSIRDASKMINIFSAKNNCKDTMIVVNRIRGDMVASGEMLSHSDIVSLLNKKLVGIIPESDAYNVTSSFDKHKLFNKDPIFNAFTIFAKNLIDNANQEFDYTAKYCGILGLIRRKLKKL